MPRPPNVSALLSQLTRSLGHESAKLELKWMQQELQARSSAGSIQELVKMVARRTDGEPLQYILGNQPFGPITLKTRAPTLIPRPETEDWTLRVASLLNPTPAKPVSILDLCTGSGCIPILLGHLWPKGSTRAVGVDISPEALSLAVENATNHGLLQPMGNTFEVVQADMLDESFAFVIQGSRPPFDLITSNPPYIPLAEYNLLPRSVKDYEDPRALLGDHERGLSFYRRIAQLVGSGGILKSGGLVVCEVGKGQAREVENILTKEGGVEDTEVWEDPWGVERVVLGRREVC